MAACHADVQSWTLRAAIVHGCDPHKEIVATPSLGGLLERLAELGLLRGCEFRLRLGATAGVDRLDHAPIDGNLRTETPQARSFLSQRLQLKTRQSGLPWAPRLERTARHLQILDETHFSWANVCTVRSYRDVLTR
jgi:hypothetical protein